MKWQRVGILKTLSNVLTPRQLKSVTHGIFNSKLIYCLQLFGNVWYQNNVEDRIFKFSAFTKSDSQKLQVLQNKTMRLRSKMGRMTPTEDLLKACQELSVNQLAAYHTLLATHKVVRAGKPKALHEKLKINLPQDNQIVPQSHIGTISAPKANLTLTRGGFCYRGAILWNKLPQNLRQIEKYTTLKPNLKTWVRSSIPAKTT